MLLLTTVAHTKYTLKDQKTKKTFLEFFQDGQITLDNPILAQDQDEYLDVEIVFSFSGLDCSSAL
jgi:hypothetical protein